jgi:hypothetical protein
MKDIDAKITSEIKKHYIKQAITFVEKENEITEIIDAFYNLKITIDKYDIEPIRKIVVSKQFNNRLQYLFHDVKSFYITKQNENEYECTSICGYTIEVEK